MTTFLTRVLADKKEWRRMEARASAPPPDCEIRYGAIKPCLWTFTTGDGLRTMAVLKEKKLGHAGP